MCATTYTYYNGVGLRRGWQLKDKGRLYPVEGVLNNVRVLKCTSVEEDVRYATLNSQGGYFGGNNTYCAFFPRKEEHDLVDKDALPVTYKGQLQQANGDASHIVEYDYLTGSAWLTPTVGEMSFTHRGSVMRIRYIPVQSETFAEVRLIIGEKKWVTDAIVNTSQSTMSTVEVDDSIGLKLNNISVAGGEELVTYMMIAPSDLSNDEIMLKIVSDNGTVVERKLKGVNIIAGMIYDVNLSGSSDYAMQDNAAGNGESTEGMAKAGNFVVTSSVAEPRCFVPDFTLPQSESECISVLPIRGDVNRDGVVTMADANMVVDIFLTGDVDENVKKIADVNEDGYVTMADANEITNIFLSK